MNNCFNSVWDDGEWISWDSINAHIHAQELQEAYPKANPEIVHVFEDLVSAAQNYKEITGRYLQIWGELGELFAEITYGIQRHHPGTPGSDGRLGNDWIEVKTISPEKTDSKVQVKRAGNFNKLLVIRISEQFTFEAKMVNRKDLGKGTGKLAKFNWQGGNK